MKHCYFIKMPDQMRIAIADLISVEEGIHLLTRVNVPHQYRGQGHGSALLKQIVDDADQEGVTLRLCPTASGGLTDSQLVRWYGRYGFTSPPELRGVMTREPRVVA